MFINCRKSAFIGLALLPLAAIANITAAGIPGGAMYVKGGIGNLIKTVVDVIVSEKNTNEEPLFDITSGEIKKNSSDGAGFIIDEDGFIVTNWHIIDSAEKIKIVLSDGTEYSARIVGKDERSDIALLKIDVPHPLPFVKFADSDAVEIGAPVIAIGNPLGFGKTVTSGIISFKGRNLSHQIAELGSGGDLVSYLQTDAAVNYGNSGGPLFSYQGEVVGMVTVFVSDGMHSIGINFAIPSNLLQKAIVQLKHYGKLQRSWLGISVAPIKSDVLSALGFENRIGCNVTSVAKGSPASNSGIRVGDILLSVNEENISDDTTMDYLLNNLPIGSIIPIQVLRNGMEMQFNVLVGARDDDDNTNNSQEETINKKEIPSERIESIGISVADLNQDLKQYFSIPSRINGVLISNCDNMMSELSSGCVITEINQIRISSVSELKAELNKAKSKKDTRYVAFYVFDPLRKQNSSYYTAVKFNTMGNTGISDLKKNISPQSAPLSTTISKKQESDNKPIGNATSFWSKIASGMRVFVKAMLPQ